MWYATTSSINPKMQGEKASVEESSDSERKVEDRRLEVTPLEESRRDDSIDESKLLRRIDVALIPWLFLLNMLSFVDRASIGNARLYNMEADLHLSDAQYLICLSLFFVTYIIFEVPANMCLKRLRPSMWLSSVMLLWGVVMTAQGIVKNFGELLATRVLLGVFEAGFFPGTMYYLSCWYKRSELGVRYAIFASGTAIAGAFGGLIAAAISNIGGAGGKPVWAWIFIIEGLVTVVASLASFLFIQDYPTSARFISENERAYVIHRLQVDNEFSTGEQLRWRSVFKSLTDWKTWLGACCLAGAGGPVYALAFFLPSIISQLGFSATRANLLSVPVYVVATVFSWVVGLFADRLRTRGLFAAALFGIASFGCFILMFSRSPALSYFATYLVALGSLPSIANDTAWISNNVEDSYKRSVSIAIIISMANVAGLVSANTYRERDLPRYTLGYAFASGCALLGLISSIALHILLKKENERRDRGERDEVIGDRGGGNPRNGCYDSVEAAKREKGDEWSGFRYII